ncbi:glycosyl transferase group 1 [Aquabacterium sp. NJ1]|uniref:glycosyltransferase family 4 protein n=1 Tax=Aquabacterium sp. NJ1 TaxID=1538295 RepID=UPI00052C3312|nr:glycosyltransferase family 1 protein [Aquabacterium sp. NJ1]KGM40974.1 glycosyl transferase group 1 [Aquabacterium sp. NJ1]
MKLVLFCHPSFMKSESMPRFARMIGQAMQGKGLDVRYWAPRPWVYRFFDGTRLAKWAGYIDQYVLFPLEVRLRLLAQGKDTLFVFCDQALGPWVPLVKHRPHVVHAHDLLALRSALGLIPQNPTGASGRLYQRYIRWGFKQARHFISVSRRTADDLITYGQAQPQTSAVVHNGLSHPYRRLSQAEAYARLKSAGLPITEHGMILHVGGPSWYKNSAGIVHLYSAYARGHAHPLPLWMVSSSHRNADVQAALKDVPPQGQVLFFQGLENATLEAAYSVAAAFVFPSLAEGFGWPLVEAHACGCPVITTDDAPMNEVAGPLAYYLPMLNPEDDMQAWAQTGAAVLDGILCEPAAQRAEQVERRIAWASQFTTQRATDRYHEIYQAIMVK